MIGKGSIRYHVIMQIKGGIPCQIKKLKSCHSPNHLAAYNPVDAKDLPEMSVSGTF